MKYLISLGSSLIFLLIFESCSSSKELTSQEMYKTTSLPTQNYVDTKHNQGTIEIYNYISFEKFIDQVLFIGLPNSPLENPLFFLKDEDRIKSSLTYKELIFQKLDSKYIFNDNGKMYFLYDSFRKELEETGLVESFGY